MWQRFVCQHFLAVALLLLRQQVVGQLKDHKYRYWLPTGLTNPDDSLRAVASGPGLPHHVVYQPKGGTPRRVVMLTMASTISIREYIPTVLQNLHLLKVGSMLGSTMETPMGFREEDFAKQLVMLCTTDMAVNQCNELARTYQHGCAAVAEREVFKDAKAEPLAVGKSSPEHHSIGLARIKALADAVSLGYDVLFFDPHLVFFRDPLEYLYTHTNASVVVGASGCTQQQQQQQAGAPKATLPLPQDHHHLDVMFLRSSPATLRCLYNWLYYTTLGGGAESLQSSKASLDHHSFVTVFQQCIDAMGSDVINVEYLDPVAFPSQCFGKCGCNGAATRHTAARAAQAAGAVAAGGAGPGASVCPAEATKPWVAYRVSCSSSADVLREDMQMYLRLFQATIT